MKTRVLALVALLLAVQCNFAAHAQDEALGRLFYTSRQRAALDANIRSITKKPEKPAVIPPSVTLNGIVTRSDGEQTVWIDGRPLHRPDTGEFSVRIGPADPATAKLKVQGVTQRLPVRVGQRLDPVTGQTYEAYETVPPPTQIGTPRPTATSPGAESAPAAPDRE